MKNYHRDITAWVLIILFAVIIVVLYNQQNNNYVDKGKDAKLPEKLHPVVADKTEQLIQKAKKQGIHVVITEKVRSIPEQNKLYKQGRSAGGSIVTYAEGGESYHNYGLAVDFALRNKNGKVIWDTDYDGNKNGKADWFEVASIAKDLGFSWGGDWSKFKDYPHLQMDFGLSIRQLQNGVRPADKQATND